jgi:DNA-binding NarL/FixJ family response regulator
MTESARTPAITVLVVESSPILAERVLRLVASRPGVAGRLATTLDAATAQLRRRRFNAVAVDLQVARGQDLCRVRGLRAAAGEARFVVLTTDPDPETSAACLAMGADAVVPLTSGGCRLAAILDELVAQRVAAPG